MAQAQTHQLLLLLLRSKRVRAKQPQRETQRDSSSSSRARRGRQVSRAVQLLSHRMQLGHSLTLMLTWPLQTQAQQRQQQGWWPKPLPSLQGLVTK
jgi:hypothetical protein